MLPIKYFENACYISDIGRTTISRSSMWTSKKQTNTNIGTSSGAIADIFGNIDMENIIVLESSCQNVFEDEMRTRMDALSIEMGAIYILSIKAYTKN